MSSNKITYRELRKLCILTALLISSLGCLINLEDTLSTNSTPIASLESGISETNEPEVITPTIPSTFKPTPTVPPTLETHNTPTLNPTVAPTSAPTPIPTIISHTPIDPTIEPTTISESNTAFVITIEIEVPTPVPPANTKILAVKNKNNSYWLDIEITSSTETYDKIIKNVIINDNQEYVVRLSKINTEQYRGQFNIDDYLLREKTLKWANNNLDIKVENFPERVACTGSMRPIIHCGDKVIYEPANHGDPLQVGDIITYRQLVSDIDASTECPVYDDVITIAEGYIIHRIVQVLPSYNVNRYMTRGDNNPDQDSCLVKEEHVIFRALEIIPRYYVENDLEYDYQLVTHQNLLKERDILMTDYQSALLDYNTKRSLDSAKTLTSIISLLEENLKLLQSAQQGITDAVYWDD